MAGRSIAPRAVRALKRVRARREPRRLQARAPWVWPVRRRQRAAARAVPIAWPVPLLWPVLRARQSSARPAAAALLVLPGPRAQELPARQQAQPAAVAFLRQPSCPLCKVITGRGLAPEASQSRATTAR